MKLFLAVLAVAVASAAAARPKWHELANYTFEQYVADFAKTHSPLEFAARRALFEDRLAAILRHNAGSSSYKKGVNHFTDMTEEELRSTRGRSKLARASGEFEREWVSPNVELPAEVDWVKAGAVTPARDQGSCGSCWAHGTMEALESAAFLATGDLSMLSVQQLVSCAPNDAKCGGFGGCQGSIPELGYEYLIKAGGAAQEWTFSYESYWGKSNGTCRFNNVQGGTPVVTTLDGYVRVPSNDRDALMQALATKGPIAVSVAAADWSSYEGGIYDGCDVNENIDVDHVVLLVGYGTENNQDYWVIKNSWGSQWGEHGYIRLARPDKQQCGTDNTPADGTGCLNPPGPSTVTVCGTCAVTYDPVYPTGVKMV